MRTKLFLLTVILFVSCGKDKETSSYPGCFKDMENSNVESTISCGNVFVSVGLDHQKQVTIFLSEQNLELTTTCKNFDIAGNLNNLEINYYTYNNHPDSIYFNDCSDIAFSDSLYGTKVSWKAVSGNVTAIVSKDRKFRKDCESCLVSIKLDNVKFIKENSTIDTVINEIVIKDRSVGFCIP